MLALLPIAQAAEPAEDVVIQEAPDVRRKRGEVARALGGLGYRDAGRRGDALVLLAEAPWKPMVLLYDGGWVDVRRRPPVLMRPVDAFDAQLALLKARLVRDAGGPRSDEEAALVAATGGTMLVCDAWTGLACVSPAGWLVSRSRIARIEEDLYAAAGPELAAWRDAVVADRSARRLAEQVPGELAAIWSADAPAAERRARLYTWWDTRTETPAGAAARAVCVAFLHDVVQASGSPFPAEELAALNAARRSADPLVLYGE